jgi:splicing factor 3A subunit 3
MDSIIEVQRQNHEEIEHFERALYSILAKPQPTHESKLQTEHKAAQLLDRLSSRIVTLNNTYEDQESIKAELDLLSASSNPGDLSEFYKRLGKIQEHYAKYPEDVAGGFELELAAFLDDDSYQAGDEEYEEDDRKYGYHDLYSWYTDLSLYSYCSALLW